MEDNLNANEIIEGGEKLPFNWFKYNGMYYRIFNGKVYIKTSELKILEDKYAFIYRHNNHPDILILAIRNYIGVISNTGIDEITVYDDGYYICNSEDGIHRELHAADMKIIVADSIYRLENDNFVGVSNGIHYLVDIETGDNKPVSRSKVRYNKEYNILETLDEATNEWKKLEI